MSGKLTKVEIKALDEANRRPDGWGLFFPKTTKRLSGRGFFEVQMHPTYGPSYRITDAGRAALATRATP